VNAVTFKAGARRIPVDVIKDRNLTSATLLRVGCATVEELAAAVAEQFKLPRLALDSIEPNLELAPLIPRALAEKQRLVPVFASVEEVTLAVCDPTELEIFDMLRRDLKRAIALVVATPAEIQRAQRRLYEKRVEPSQAGDDATPSKEALATATAVFNRIVWNAVAQKASDIHVEPADRGTVVRYRVDGVLRVVEELPAELHPALISRIKVIARLDIAQRYLPQDGRIKMAGTAGEVDLRVSVLPTYWGEKIVCRLLDNQRAIKSLDALGFERAELDAFLRMVRNPYGLVLVTGPTGSGKSTTLYAALNAVLSREVNVVTVEDPIEYQLSGINQVPINNKRGLTFANALRSILRQDPDIILVGEIRDRETGEIAAEAALTGHLVMSSLHTNDAVSAIARLTEIGVPPHLVAPSLLGVVAQRLVRRICGRCAESYAPPADELAMLGLPHVPEGTRVARGRGCSACSGTGYAGRVAVREVLTIDETLRAAIARNATTDVLRGLVAKTSFKTMRFAALRAWLAGTTTAREVMRLTCG
jgi:type IV pilus assembly protein PilB